MQLPIFKDPSVNLMLMQNRWASILNPVLANNILQGNQINAVSLVANTPQAINHLLSRMQQGWFLTDVNSAAHVWRTQPFNDKTLTLESSANTTVNIWVF